MADDARHAIVHQLLRDRDRRLGIGRIVLGIEHERHVLTANANLPAVQVFDREPHTVFVVLSDVGQFAGQGDTWPIFTVRSARAASGCRTSVRDARHINGRNERMVVLSIGWQERAAKPARP